MNKKFYFIGFILLTIALGFTYFYTENQEVNVHQEYQQDSGIRIN